MEPEEGELSSSSDEVYTPLQRPETTTPSIKTSSPQQAVNEILEDIDSLSSGSEDDSSDNCLKDNTDKSQRKKRTKRTVMLRVQAAAEEDAIKKARFKKYNIWTAAAEEEALTENMRGCDVTHKKINDRSVETYDFNLVNGRKRRRNGSDDELYPISKRNRDSSQDSNSGGQRESVKSRLGHRLILDLDDISNRDPADVGREMANKLFEDKDDLLVRIVEVLGVELSTEIYNETQKIEADGGMLINNGARRRTPGGVFLFLLKKHDRITYADRKLIFDEDRKNQNKSKKEIETALRDRKVQELKQRLSRHENLPTLSTRKELILAKSQSGNLSNPPPSPVVGQENSPEYKSSAIINHVVPDACPSTSSASTFKDITTLNDDLDFLDLNYPDMDFF